MSELFTSSSFFLDAINAVQIKNVAVSRKHHILDSTSKANFSTFIGRVFNLLHGCVTTLIVRADEFSKIVEAQ